MASGTGERPLGTPAQEKELLMLSNVEIVKAGLSGGATRYVDFTLCAKAATGVLISVGNANTKKGMYIYYVASNGTITIQPILAISQSGFTITTGTNYLKVVNGASYATILVFAIDGGAPVVSSTQPT